MLLGWLFLLVMLRDAVAQDETVSAHTKFNVTLPSENSEKPRSPGAFQLWYKGSTDAEDGILSYTLPLGPLTYVNDPDVKHGFDISSASLIIYNVSINDGGTYFYVEGLHEFSVFLNVTELDSDVLSNNLVIKFNDIETEITNGALQVEVSVGDSLQIEINSTDLEGETPRLVLKEESEIQLDDDGNPGFLVFSPNTNIAGSKNYTVEATLFDVVGKVNIEVTALGTSTDRSSPTKVGTEVPHSSTISSSHFPTGSQTTELDNRYTSSTSETDSSNPGGSTTSGINQVGMSSITTVRELDTTTMYSSVGAYTSTISESTTEKVLSSTTLTESDHFAVLAVPGIVVFIGVVVALSVVFFVKLQGSGTASHLSNMYSQFSDRTLQYDRHISYPYGQNGIGKWNYRNMYIP